MRDMRWAALALSLGIMVGCTSLTPGSVNQISSLLGQFGLSLKTVDSTTGAEKTYTQADVDTVVDSDGKAVSYKFDDSGKMVFTPNKAGPQTIKVKLKDGTVQQFDIEGKSGGPMQTGDVAFIPDASGQGYATKVAVGSTINVVQEKQTMVNNMAGKRIKVTFGMDKLEGLSKDKIKGIFMERSFAPMDAFNVTASGDLMVDPAFFFTAREFYKINNSYPKVRVVYLNPDNKLVAVVAQMTALPTLPDFTPSKPGEPPPPPISPDKFTAGQTVDLSDATTEEVTSLDAYMQEVGLVNVVAKVGATPPPPNPQEQQQQFTRMKARSVLINLPGAFSAVSTSSIRGIMVGRMERPAMDVMAFRSSTSTSSIRLDPNLVISWFSYYKGPLGGIDSPWIRIWFVDGNVNKVLKFRILTASIPDWLKNINYTPPQPPNPIPQGWMPPPPPVDLIPAGMIVGESAVEASVELLGDPDTYQQNLFNSTLKNP